MKKPVIIAIVIGLVVLMCSLVFGVSYLTNAYLSSDRKVGQSIIRDCKTTGKSHIVTIQNNAPNPKHTDGSLCDTLTITNNYNRLLLIAFGQHDNHQPYDGITEQQLTKGQSFTITLNQTGTYQFHDHIFNVVRGDFTVTQ